MTTPLYHLQTYYPDVQVAKDMDCVYAALRYESELLVAKEYAKARRRAPHFAPGREGANNHTYLSEAWSDLQGLADWLDTVPEDKREEVLKRAVNGDTGMRECEKCHTPYLPKRSDSRFCGDRCRKAANRSGDVTDSAA